MQPLTKASSTPLLRQESLSRMPLHIVENTHTKPSWTPLSQQESPPRMLLLMQQGGHKTVEGFNNCKNRVQQIDVLCGPCHKRVPKKLKAVFCIIVGVGDRVCGREIYRGNQWRKCYDHPDEKKMREEKKAARPKCTINGCVRNELRSY